jgi:hypothetical protein
MPRDGDGNQFFGQIIWVNTRIDIPGKNGRGASSIGSVRIEYVDYVLVHDTMDGEVVSVWRKQDASVLGRFDTDRAT